MKQYRALRAFAHENSHADKGAVVTLSDKQAQYLLTSGCIEPIEKPAAPKKSAGKPKSDDTKDVTGGDGKAEGGKK